MNSSFGEIAAKCAESIGNYCSTRFQQDIEPMLDLPWFAERIQKAIDEALAAAATKPEAVRIIGGVPGWSND